MFAKPSSRSLSFFNQPGIYRRILATQINGKFRMSGPGQAYAKRTPLSSSSPEGVLCERVLLWSPRKLQRSDVSVQDALHRQPRHTESAIGVPAPQKSHRDKISASDRQLHLAQRSSHLLPAGDPVGEAQPSGPLPN